MPPPPKLSTIQQYVEQNADLTKFAAWAKQSGVWDEVPTIGSYTIFIPTNKAVEDLGPKNQQFLLAPTNIDNLRNVILNHGVALGKYAVKDLKGLPSIWTLITEVTIRESRGELWIADARIMTADVECSNGIVHVIDKVLIPPSVLEVLVHPSTWYFPNVEMVVVPRGQFQMGAPADEDGRYRFVALPAGTYRFTHPDCAMSSGLLRVSNPVAPTPTLTSSTRGLAGSTIVGSRRK